VIALGADPLAHSLGFDLARAGYAIRVFARLDTHALAANGTLSLFHIRGVMLTLASCLDNPQWRTYRTRVDAELLDSPT
jgi:hypothetical protein